MLDGLKSHPERLLLDHINGVKKRALEKANSIKWNNFGITEKDAIKLIEICALCHDFAKASSGFQKYITSSKKGAHVSHAPLSSIITYHIAKNTGFEPKYASFAYFVVRCHHESMKDFQAFGENLEALEKQMSSIPKEFIDWVESKLNTQVTPKISEIYGKLEKDVAKLNFFRPFSLKDYLFVHTLLSILVSSDHEDAALHDTPLILKTRLTLENLRKYMHAIPEDNPLYSLRKEFHIDLDNSLKYLDDSKIYSITAPTGLGKTLANLKVALSLSDESLIVYALPFINIIDQTVETFQKIMQDTEFDASTILPYHHLANPKYEEDIYGEKAIQKVLIESWHSQIVVTTFVGLFESLLTSKRVPFFYKLLNATIILDEVQSIPHKYWNPLADILSCLSEFGTKIIFSTATQPMIITKTRELINKNYNSKLNRTRIHYCGEIDYPSFMKQVEEEANKCLEKNQRLLVVVNTIRQSKELFNHLRSTIDISKLVYLSSNVIPKQRLERVSGLKKLKNQGIICISTQVIEAGVDLSFNKIIRDEGPIDSVIQVAGRCNRNFETPISSAHIYRAIDKERNRSFASYVYDHFLLDMTRELLSSKKEFEEKEFPEIVSRYFNMVKERGNTDRENLTEQLRLLKFEEISSKFKLIEKRYDTVPVFIEYDEYAQFLRKKLNETLNSKMEKFEKLAQISELIRQMSLYTIDVPLKSEDLRGALLIENGFLVVTKDNLNYWYDEYTGFQRSQELMIF